MKKFILAFALSLIKGTYVDGDYCTYTASGTVLNCNTTADTGLTAPRFSAKSAGTSFTINLGTFSTNPMCFNYWMVN